MPAKTEWFAENQIILTTFTGDLTLDEVTLANEEHYKLIANANKTIYVVFNVSQLVQFPTDVRTLKKSSDAYLSLDNMGWIMVVGIKNPILRFLSTILSQLANVNMKQVATIDDAIQQLNYIDGIN